MIGEKFREFLLTFRQGILIILGGIEEYLEMERSVIPQHKKNKREKHDTSNFDTIEAIGKK